MRDSGARRDVAKLVSALSPYYAQNPNGNLFDYTKAISGFSVSNTTGALIDQSASGVPYYVSDYIPISPSATYTKSGQHPIAFYDSSKVFISGLAFGAGSVTFTTPSNAAFVRITVNANTNQIATYMMIKGPTLPGTYQAPSYVYSFSSGGSSGSTNNPLSGLNANMIGDSLTYGQGLASQSLAWPQLLGNKLGLATVRNYGISGSTMADGSNPMYTRYSGMDANADLIFVMGGRNDFVSGTIPFGSIDSPTTEASFFGRVKSMAEGLIGMYPSKTIIFVTPPHGSSSSMPETNTNATTGKTYKEYIQAIRDIANFYSFPVCDLWNSAGMQPLVSTSKTAFYQSDGVHPNEAGHARQADRIAAFVNTLV